MKAITNPRAGNNQGFAAYGHGETTVVGKDAGTVSQCRSAPVRQLSRGQLDGCACVVCGDNFRPMLPLGLETKISSDVFRCDRPECVVETSQVKRWIIASEQPTAERLSA